MRAFRQGAALIAVAVALCLGTPAMSAAPEPQQVLTTWYRLILELVRHTPTYSPAGGQPRLRLYRCHRL